MCTLCSVTSTSRSNLGGRPTLGPSVSHLLQWCAGVRACPPLFFCVVTQSDTHSGRDPRSSVAAGCRWSDSDGPKTAPCGGNATAA